MKPHRLITASFIAVFSIGLVVEPFIAPSVQALPRKTSEDGGGGGAIKLPQNGNFEVAVVGTPSMPQAWNQGPSGANTSTFAYPVTGRSGRGAKVTVTSYTGGDAKWYFAPIPSSAGRTYQFQTDYQSNVPTNISIEFRMVDGTYSYGWLGNPSTSSSWTTYTGQFTAPLGAASFTVFQSLVSVGTLTIDNVQITETTNGAGVFARGMITLEFDDTVTSHYTVARPILNAAGVKASFYAITDPVVGIGSSAYYMTWANVLQLKADGHEIGAHTRTHPNLTLLTPTQSWDEIYGSKIDLQAHGITPMTFVYPFGGFNAVIKQQVKDAGFTGARSVYDGINFPTTDRYAMFDKHIESDTTVASVQSWINQAVANQTWLILELHDQAETGSNQYHNSPAVLQGIVDAITSSGIQAVTMQQGMALMNP